MFRAARTTRTALIALAATAALSTAAYAAPATVSPPNKAQVAAPVVLTWGLAPGERASKITVETLTYVGNKPPTAKVYESAAIADGTTSYSTTKRYFFGDYRWGVSAVDAAGAPVASPGVIFTVKPKLSLGKPKVTKARPTQLRITLPITTNHQFFDASIKVKVGGKVWYTEKGSFRVAEKGIGRPLRGIAFITEHKPANVIPAGTKFQVITTVKAEVLSRTTSTTYVA